MESPPSQEELIPPPAIRRARLNRNMDGLAAEGKTCALCSGVCCTFVANSMRITPVEALDMKRWLESQGRWTPALFDRLRETVSRYRLDQETGDGRRALRKTYTCPFHTPGPRGCSIDRDHKPYGCLAFNPRVGGQTEGGNCASSQSDLSAREGEFPGEEAANRRLGRQWGPHGETAPIPVALLALLQ